MITTQLSDDATTIDRKVIGLLSRVLADTYVLAVKTHGAHWNVKGPGFFRLHAAFEEEYQELLAAADVLAERIRAMGENAPASMKQMLALSSIAEPPGDQDNDLVRALRDDHRAIAGACREALEMAQQAKDEATADMLITRIEDHDKTSWMLSATLGEK